MRSIFFLAVVALANSATDLCMPSVHEAFVSTRANVWSDTAMSHHHDEYYEGDFLHVWYDGVSKKTLVHVFEEEWFNHRGETHHIFSLRDYSRKYHWRGKWNFDTQSVTECYVEKMDRTFEPYCVARGASLTGSGTLSEHAKVDFWSARYDEPDRHFFEDIHVILEAGSTNLIVQERVFGEHFNTTEQTLYEWVEHREWFDVNEKPIDQSVFKIPAGCPPI